MSETMQEFYERNKSDADVFYTWEAARDEDDISPLEWFAHDAWAVIKAEVERQAEAVRTPPIALDEQVITLHAKTISLRSRLDEALDALAGMVSASCTVLVPSADAGLLDSMCNGDQADAMRVLAHAGRLVIDSDDEHNRVVGHWLPAHECRKENE